MSQQAISSYFATRKRGVTDDSATIKSKSTILNQDEATTKKRITRATQKLTFESNLEETVSVVTPKKRKRSITSKNDGVKATKTPKTRARKTLVTETDGMQQTKLVDFVVKGLLSPKKTLVMESPQQEKSAFGSKDNDLNAERGLLTPVKQRVSAEPRPSTTKKIKEMPMEKIKARLGKSDRLTELKTRLNNLQQGFDRLDRMQDERKALISPKKTIEITHEISNQPKSLKKFEQLEVEVLR